MTQAIEPASVFDQVHQWMTSGGPRPSADEVVAAVLSAEKACRRSPKGDRWTYAELQGSWRLTFITGTRASQQRAGVVLGQGRFVPRWVTVSLTYGGLDLAEAELGTLPEGIGAPNAADPDAVDQIGWAQNRVALVETAMTVSGPTKLWPNGILAFDFTRMAVGLGPWSPLKFAIRNGVSREAAFAQLPLKQQAFFRYFAVKPNFIAARGRGGGVGAVDPHRSGATHRIAVVPSAPRDAPNLSKRHTGRSRSRNRLK